MSCNCNRPIVTTNQSKCIGPGCNTKSKSQKSILQPQRLICPNCGGQLKRIVAKGKTLLKCVNSSCSFVRTIS